MYLDILKDGIQRGGPGRAEARTGRAEDHAERGKGVNSPPPALTTASVAPLPPAFSPLPFSTAAPVPQATTQSPPPSPYHHGGAGHRRAEETAP